MSARPSGEPEKGRRTAGRLSGHEPDSRSKGPAPTTGVIALSGSTPDPPGSVLTRLQASATAEPVSRVSGISSLWFDEPVISRAR